MIVLTSMKELPEHCYDCPCGSKLYEVDRELNMTCRTKFKYCPECGRKIDWSGVDK